MDYHKGRGAQINTSNWFSQANISQEHVEGIDEEQETGNQTQVFYETSKKLINTIESPDLYAMRSVNPYQGCEHGCIYCYARNSHEYWGFSAGMDFESKIVVKKHAASLLEKEFLRKNYQPVSISLSGNTDCYQPLERKLEITRSLLKVFVKYAHPVNIITKNSLVKRDIDLLQVLAKQNLVHVYMSITTLEEELRQKMEPRTATAKSRLQTIKVLADAGIPVGVMAAPLIPGLNHTEVASIIREAGAQGAISAGYTVVRLNGALKEIFYDWLQRNFPERAAKVWHLISDMHGGQVNDSHFGRRMTGEDPIADMIKQLFTVSRHKYMQNKQMPGYNYSLFRRGGNLNLFENS